MTRLVKFMPIIVALAAFSGCAAGAYGPSIETPIRQAPREIDELSVQERQVLLDRAQVFRPIDTAALDLMAGPGGKRSFRFDDDVTCTFAYPDEPLSGVTPKFECEVAPGDIVKVKYGENNGEVFAEVAATRLF